MNANSIRFRRSQQSCRVQQRAGQRHRRSHRPLTPAITPDIVERATVGWPLECVRPGSKGSALPASTAFSRKSTSS